MKQRLPSLCAALLLLVATSLTAQVSIRGRITDADGKQPLAGANVFIVGASIGAAADADGNYVILNAPKGTLKLRVTFVGYTTIERTLTVGASDVTLNFQMKESIFQMDEVIADANRARDRETPVAFTTVAREAIEQRSHGQDAPLLLQGTPGLFAFGSDGNGATGEAKLFVRGFTQDYVQVLINGVPTNDPESNRVYWSNWGSVSANAASIQVQRGAGSSLYGAGSFGGSFNIVTGDASPKSFYGINATFGSPMNTFYGLVVNTGLIDNMAFSLRVDRKITEGSRMGARYEGVNYYLSGSWFPAERQSLKLVLHGAPQEHGYTFSNDYSYFAKYGYEANSAPWLQRSIIETFGANVNDGKANYGLLDDEDELVGPDNVALAHNFFHKPQLELHYNYDLSPTSSIRATVFHSIGRGAGSSMNSTGTTFRRSSSTNVLTSIGLDSDGAIVDPLVADTLYLKNAFQRTSFSLHQQSGIIASWDEQFADLVRVTAGGEFRYWQADHPGHFTNLYKKTSVTTTYAATSLTGTVGTFSRRVYQGNLDKPNDIGFPFGWNMAEDADPTYKTQYRNYLGETPQFTIYAQGNWNVMENLNLLTSVQYVWYQYKLTENMPSESAIGQEVAAAPASGVEGPDGTGKFYMQGTNNKWYVFDLVNADRSRGFLQPKAGINFNVTDNLNLFANYAHVERFVDLGVYYRQGLVNPDAEDEKSDQIEVGIGWGSKEISAKLNAYSMTWQNKSATIQDVSKAGQGYLGYDRNGFRTDLVGESRHQGIEFELSGSLDDILPIAGLSYRGSLTIMDNKWTKVLDEVKLNPNGSRRAFNTSALDADGKVDTLFFDELEDTPVASQAQTMASLSLTYKYEDFFAGIDMNHFARMINLDGGTHMVVDGTISTDAQGREVFTPVYSDKLPDATVFDFFAGYNYSFFGVRGTLSAQVINLFDTKYLISADRFGVFPGALRTLRFNISAGI